MRSLDTSIAVDHLRNHPPATGLLDRLLADRQRLIASEVVRFEVLAGLHDHERAATELLFETVDVIPVTEPISRRAADFARAFRASHSGMDTADYLIAATAAALEAPLLTLNVRHFPMFPDLVAAY